MFENCFRPFQGDQRRLLVRSCRNNSDESGLLKVCQMRVGVNIAQEDYGVIFPKQYMLITNPLFHVALGIGCCNALSLIIIFRILASWMKVKIILSKGPFRRAA